VWNSWEERYTPYDPVALIPPGVSTLRELADFWIRQILGRPMAPQARDAVVDFVARGRDPETPLRGFSDPNLRERIWGTVALLMTSPDFLER
jgi:hypothetical protein